MTDITFQGGPFDGRTGTVYGVKLRVAAGYDYGWTHACGHRSLDWGEYDHTGKWEEPKLGVVHENDCPTCDEFGRVDF